VLVRLDQINGVKQSYANRTGTMVRVSLAGAADLEAVANEVRKAIGEEQRKPVRLTGDKLKQSLEKEEWREKERIDELSAIEFRTFALRAAVRKFAAREELAKSITEKLTGIVEQQWFEITKPRETGKGKEPTTSKDWESRREQLIISVADQAKELLTAGQIVRLKQALATLPKTDRPKPKDG
jgi:hypothetical protein